MLKTKTCLQNSCVLHFYILTHFCLNWVPRAQKSTYIVKHNYIDRIGLTTCLGYIFIINIKLQILSAKLALLKKKIVFLSYSTVDMCWCTATGPQNLINIEKITNKFYKYTVY